MYMYVAFIKPVHPHSTDTVFYSESFASLTRKVTISTLLNPVCGFVHLLIYPIMKAELLYMGNKV